jgi:hypothetical protein
MIMAVPFLLVAGGGWTTKTIGGPFRNSARRMNGDGARKNQSKARKVSTKKAHKRRRPRR